MVFKNVALIVLIVLFGAFSCKRSSQNSNTYGLEIVSTISDYKKNINENSDNILMDIEQLIPDIALDIKYATDENFTGKKVYESPKAFLRKPVAEALQKVQHDLSETGLGLKVFDAYRPYSATVKFYEIIGDTNFVAAPWHGSRHNRGCAVDVTLIDLATGMELEMPTPFDDFTEKAAPDYSDLPPDVIKNRTILINAMKKRGFSVYPHEWWHFDYQGWEKFALMNISFEALELLTYY
jgi:zinc D-Ala-D-Ala dipeptidase